jgi:hypothetical protein
MKVSNYPWELIVVSLPVLGVFLEPFIKGLNV